MSDPRQTYEKRVLEIVDSQLKTASEAVPELYGYLKASGMKPKDARKQIEYDLGQLWKLDTIQRYLPEECIDQNAKALGEKGASKKNKLSLESIQRKSENTTKSEIIIDTDGKPVEAKDAGGGGGGIIKPPEPSPEERKYYSELQSEIAKLQLDVGREREARLAQEAKAKEIEQRADELEYRKDQVEQELRTLKQPPPVDSSVGKWWADFAIDMDNGSVFCGKVQVDCANKKVHAVFDPRRSAERNPK